jgi:hypothetical protein
MSSDPIPEDENPEIDDGTLSDVIRKPTRTAGDLSEVAEGAAGLTTEDVVRDLESVASKSRTQTERVLLEDLLRRVERIEEHLGIADPGPGSLPTSNPPGTFEGPDPRRHSAEHPTVRNPERGKSRSTGDLERRAHAQRSGEGETNQPEESSEPEE